VKDYSQFENHGIYYAATAMESLLCSDNEVIVVISASSLGHRVSDGVVLHEERGRCRRRSAVMLLNASDRSASMKISWSELGLLPGAKARDLWKYRDLPAGDG
jgi:hypothetical protein